MVRHLRGGHHARDAAGEGHLDVTGGFVHALDDGGLDDGTGLGSADILLLPRAVLLLVPIPRRRDAPRRERELNLPLAAIGPNHGGAHHLTDRESLVRGLIGREAEVLRPRQPADVPVELNEDPVRFHARHDTVRGHTR